jgi:hypothetical protein
VGSSWGGVGGWGFVWGGFLLARKQSGEYGGNLGGLLPKKGTYDFGDREIFTQVTFDKRDVAAVVLHDQDDQRTIVHVIVVWGW